MTSGNNCVTGPDCVTPGNIYPATANYDLATGVGTPKVGAIANYLVPPSTATEPSDIGLDRNGVFILSTSNTAPNAAIIVGFGSPSDRPVVWTP